MPNNVYIGSRYLPLFDGAWSPIKSYEALIIVEYGNNSYTSKRPVPVNTPPTTGDENDPYWGLSGNYNGQISNLQQQINTNTSDITALANKLDRNIIIVGDSYATTNGGGVTVTPYPTRVKSILGLDNNHFHVSAQNGAGFINGMFLSGIQTLTISDPNLITEVYVFSGWNDASGRGSKAALISAMEAFSSYVHTTFPNAKLYCGFMGYGLYSASELVTLGQAYDTYKDCVKYGFDGYINTEWLCVTRDTTMWANPSTSQGKGHPSDALEEIIGYFVAEGINNKHINFHIQKVGTVSEAGDITHTEGGAFVQTIDHDTISTLIVGNIVLQVSSGKAITAGTEYEMLTITQDLSIGYGDYTKGGGVADVYTSGTAHETMVFKWLYKDGKIYIAFPYNSFTYNGGYFTFLSAPVVNYMPVA